MLLAAFELYLSYKQFMVYDQSVDCPGLAWKEAHSRQGFIRRESVVNFGAFADFGYAPVRVFLRPFLDAPEYRRVISVPFYTPTGTVLIEGPEEISANRMVKIDPGHYLLTAAQALNGVDPSTDEPLQAIDLFFTKLDFATNASAIIKSDEELDPPNVLIEEGETASF